MSLPVVVIGEWVATTPPPEEQTSESAESLWEQPTDAEAIEVILRALDRAGIEMPAEIIALQATPSFRAAFTGEREITPGGGVRTSSDTKRG